MSTAIHWFRRDLRLTDNTSLLNAASAHDHVVPVYVVSTWKRQHRWTGAPRQEFLCGCLEALAKNLETKGGRLIVLHGEAEKVLPELARKIDADAIHFNRDPDPFGRGVEEKLAAAAGRLGIRVHSHKDIAIHERDEVLTGSGKPFRIFTPYSKAWLRLDKQAPRRSVARISTSPDIHSDPLPTLPTWKLKSDAKIIDAGEAAARRRLSRFLDGPLFEYVSRRDLPGEETTSRLSQDLRHGLLSIREVHAKCAEAAKGATAAQRRSTAAFINELIWREFYMQVLWHWPGVLDHEFKEDYRKLKWSRAGDAFDRWTAGETGFPIVDAGMRQLAATGFMHNRVRMIVAMFLTKDLHIDWRAGESWFMQHLVDGEIASNNGGWQWSASTGTDAAPYFRIQNPWSQTARFDPDGNYIKRWVSELRDVPSEKFCEPPSPGDRIAKAYPKPIVDHAWERKVSLELYRR